MQMMSDVITSDASHPVGRFGAVGSSGSGWCASAMDWGVTICSSIWFLSGLVEQKGVFVDLNVEHVSYSNVISVVGMVGA